MYTKLLGPKDGTPVLLIHGAWGTGESDFGDFSRELANAGYRIILPDLRGYGKSSSPERIFTAGYLNQDAEDMATLIRAVSPKKPVIVMGYSDGGETGLLLTAHHPELVAGSVLWGTSGKITKELIDTFSSTIPKSGDPLWQIAGDDGWKDWGDTLIERHGEKSFNSAIFTYPSAVQAIYDKGGAIISDEDIAKIARPVFLTYGVKDEYNPTAEVEALAKKIPVSQVTVKKIENSGHKLQTEQPSALLTILKELTQKIQ